MREGLDVLAIGNINIDISFFVSKAPESDMEALADDFAIFHGGAAANFSVGMARLGVNCGILGCVGDDDFGRRALEELEREGISTECVTRIAGGRTGAVCVMVEEAGTRRMIAYRGANGRIEEHLRKKLPECHSKIIQLCNVNRKVLRTALELGKGAIISLDPGGAAAEIKPEDLAGVDFIFLNDLECKMITGKPMKDGMKLLAQNVPTVVVKQGSEGATMLDAGVEIKAYALKVDVLDTTGAGDAFDAGFIAAISKGLTKREALSLGIAVAALKIQKKGAREGLPSIQELMRFLDGKK